MTRKIKCLVMIALMLFVGCATVTLDGNLDPVESAIVRIAVGAALTAEPQTVVPAYAVSTALMAILDGTEITELNILEERFNEEMQKLELNDAERASFLELAALVRMHIIQHLPDDGLDQQIVIVRQVVKIIRDASMARI